jgi:hypothetical protein
MPEHFETSSKIVRRGRGMAQKSLRLIEAMYEAAAAAQPITGRNKTSVRELIKAYGQDSRDWTGKEVELYAGQVDFKDGKADAVLVKPISPPTSDGKLPPPKPKAAKAEFDDDIPY